MLILNWAYLSLPAQGPASYPIFTIEAPNFYFKGPFISLPLRPMPYLPLPLRPMPSVP